MKKIGIFLVSMALFLIPSTSQAAIYWTWDVYQYDNYVKPGDNIIWNAYLTNLDTSTENLAFDDVTSPSASYTNSGAELSFSFGDESNNWSETFHNIVLAPGETYNFVFGVTTIKSIIADGTYTPSLAIHNLKVANVANGVDSRRPNIHVSSNTVPEPASLSLLIFGLLGFLLKKKKTA